MKFIPLHTKTTSIVYKNSLCSTATIFCLIFVALCVMIPVLLVSLLSPYSGIAESRVLYEQPRVAFKFQHLFVGELLSNDLIACSSFANFNAAMGEQVMNYCDGVEYWTEDLDFDGNIDRAHFKLQLETLKNKLKSFDIALFFEAKLKHKCELSPPALLTQQRILPSSVQFKSGNIVLKAELQLRQYAEFDCPFPGRNSKTNFRHIQLNGNSSNADLSQFKLQELLRQLNLNAAYFQLFMREEYYDQPDADGLSLHLQIDILQIPARYHLSIWERLGQFWLYFASFFGISFYIMNKIKDYLFGRHIIRAWEVIPWKELY